MIRVKYKTLSADPDKTIYPGTVVSVDDAEAKELIENGYVELTESEPEAEKVIDTDDKKETDKKHHGKKVK